MASTETESVYARYLTDNTTVWLWGAFTFPSMTVFAPVGSLGEPRDFIANSLHETILSAEG